MGSDSGAWEACFLPMIIHQESRCCVGLGRGTALQWNSFLLGVAILLCSIVGLQADRGSQHGTLSVQLAEAVKLYDAGWSGSDVALKGAVGLLENGSFKDLEINLARAYRGSAWIAYARLMGNWEKVKWLKRGGQELDRAVEREPESIPIRLLRMKSFAILPRLAGKWEVVLGDAGWLLHEMESDRVPEACRGEVFLQVGSVYLRDRDSRALELLARAVEVAPTKELRDKAFELHRLARLQFRVNDFD